MTGRSWPAAALLALVSIVSLWLAPVEVHCGEHHLDMMEELKVQVENLAKVFSLEDKHEHKHEEHEEKLDPLDHFFLDVVPTMFNQRPNNENGTESQFKDYLMSDESNDDAWHLSGTEIIERSGYKYETFDAIADDGYITIMTRIINPLADKRFLRYPPVILEHGGTIDPTAYLLASSIQHRPEKWPRSPEDGPITSWNRSLAFMLANNGFDVWLAETRGSNDKNQRKIAAKSVGSVLRNRNAQKNMTIGENLHQLMTAKDYWSFTQDDIIANELKSHIDTVLYHTGAKHVSLFTFSLSTPTSLAFFSLRDDYAEKVRGYVCMAPIVSGEGVNLLIKIALETICPMLPDDVGFHAFTDLIFTQPMRDLIVFLSQEKKFRYSFVKMIVSLLMGPSAKWKTLLELNLLGHMLRKLSFREAKQLCQQMDKNKLQKYDYGPIKNELIYKQAEPPVYDLTKLHISDWIVVSGSNDALSTLPVLDHLLSLVNPKPIATIMAPGFNHLDLIGAVDNDKWVNLPVLAYLQSVSTVPGIDGGHDHLDDHHHHKGEWSPELHHQDHHEQDHLLAEGSEPQAQQVESGFNLRQFLPSGFDLEGLTGSSKSGANSDGGDSETKDAKSKNTIVDSLQLDTVKILESMNKNLQSMLSSFGGNFDKIFKMFDQQQQQQQSGSSQKGEVSNKTANNKLQ